MREPGAEQVQAHEAYLRLVEELAASEEVGDRDRIRALRGDVAAAKRHWHRLVREVETAQRSTRRSR